MQQLDTLKTNISQHISQGKLAQGMVLHGYDQDTITDISNYYCNTLFPNQDENNPDLHIINEEKSIKIDRIKTLQDQIKYGPSHHPYLLVVIKKADLMTVEASNALLKTLEEPPKGVHFLLESTQKHKLLATIKSRCQLVFVPGESPPITPQLSLTQLIQLSIPEKLALAEDLGKDKELAKNTLYSWTKESLELNPKRLDLSEKIAEKCHDLEYNVNTKLQLEALFLECV